MREELIKLLKESGVAFPISTANFLIANGVEIPVHCCDCAKCITHIDEVGCSWLFCKRQKGTPMVDPTHFCSYGERRDNG